MNHVYFLYINILWNNGCLQTKNTLKANGEAKPVSPVRDLNDFWTGIGLFYSDITNIPYEAWWRVESAGNDGTAVQTAIDLLSFKTYMRHCAAGEWSEWKIKNNIYINDEFTLLESALKWDESKNKRYLSITWLEPSGTQHETKFYCDSEE